MIHKKNEQFKRPGVFKVLNEMALRDMEIARSTDVMNCNRQPKKNGGTISMGIASPAFDWIINSFATGIESHFAVLFVVNSDQYEQIEKELSNDAT